MSALLKDVLPHPPRGPLPLLLVEDNDGDADLIQDLLAETDHATPRAVLRATRLAEALTLLQTQRVTAVLLDLHLPDASGVDCVTAVRAQARDVPIVVLTGMDDDALALSCVSAGAQDYLSKQDVRPRALSRAIDYAVVRARESRERLRTQALQLRSAELEQENQRILEVSRRKGRYLANMSHELRTPLNAIIGFSQLLSEGDPPMAPDQVKRFSTHILSSGRHLLGVINDVLDLAKFEAGALELRPELTDVAEIAREVVDVVTGGFADKPMLVDLDVDPALRAVWIDPLRLRQVLYNYLSNAWKFTPPCGRLTVRAAPVASSASERAVTASGGAGTSAASTTSTTAATSTTSTTSTTAVVSATSMTAATASPSTASGATATAASARWRLEVVDTGAGIATQDLTRLFTEFTQLSQDARCQYRGTGLGLALTKRIVEAQGGTVGALSVPGQGSTFFAEFPAVVVAGQDEDPINAAADAGAGVGVDADAAAMRAGGETISTSDLLTNPDVPNLPTLTDFPDASTTKGC